MKRRGLKTDEQTLFPFNKNYLLVSFILLSSTSCFRNIPQPIEEYSFARAAIEAAHGAQAPRLAHGYWSQADEAYRLGKLYYSEREYIKAKAQFIKAREAAEKAENAARVLKFKSGDFL